MKLFPSTRLRIAGASVAGVAVLTAVPLAYGAVSASAATAPAKPSGVKVTATADGSITVSWSRVSGATAYEAQAINASTKSGGKHDNNIHTTSDTITGLTPGTAYNIEVDADKGSIHSGWTAPVVAYTTAAQGIPGAPGKDGAPGSDASMKGAIYSTETYTNGGDGWATAACDPTDAANSQKYVAVAGGVEEDDAPGNAGPAGSSVITSFPGRMDFTGDANNDSPMPGRLDGWVVGLSGGDNKPLKVWAMCVPVDDFGGSAPQIVNNSTP